jgi:hypothetical protein
LTSPNSDKNSPSSIILASHEYSNEFVFPNLKSEKKEKYIIQLRYEHSLGYSFSKDPKDIVLPSLNAKISGIHIGN